MMTTDDYIDSLGVPVGGLALTESCYDTTCQWIVQTMSGALLREMGEIRQKYYNRELLTNQRPLLRSRDLSLPIRERHLNGHLTQKWTAIQRYQINISLLSEFWFVRSSDAMDHHESWVIPTLSREASQTSVKKSFWYHLRLETYRSLISWHDFNTSHYSGPSLVSHSVMIVGNSPQVTKSMSRLSVTLLLTS